MGGTTPLYNALLRRNLRFRVLQLLHSSAVQGGTYTIDSLLLLLQQQGCRDFSREELQNVIDGLCRAGTVTTVSEKYYRCVRLPGGTLDRGDD